MNPIIPAPGWSIRFKTETADRYNDLPMVGWFEANDGSLLPIVWDEASRQLRIALDMPDYHCLLPPGRRAEMSYSVIPAPGWVAVFRPGKIVESRRSEPVIGWLIDSSLAQVFPLVWDHEKKKSIIAVHHPDFLFLRSPESDRPKSG